MTRQSPLRLPNRRCCRAMDNILVVQNQRDLGQPGGSHSCQVFGETIKERPGSKEVH